MGSFGVIDHLNLELSVLVELLHTFRLKSNCSYKLPVTCTDFSEILPRLLLFKTKTRSRSELVVGFTSQGQSSVAVVHGDVRDVLDADLVTFLALEDELGSALNGVSLAA